MVSSRRDGPLKVEVSLDHQVLPAVETDLGTTIDSKENGANKILTVYSNPTRGRDADDIARLCVTHTFDDMLDLAGAKEPSPPDITILADMFAALSTVDDPTFQPSAAVRQFMADIAAHLRHNTPLPPSPYTRSD